MTAIGGMWFIFKKETGLSSLLVESVLLLVFFWYNVLSCSRCCQDTCAVTCWYWYECKHIRDGHVKKQLYYTAAQWHCF